MKYSIEELAKKVNCGDNAALAQGITLIESSKATDWENAKKLLSLLAPPQQQTQRVGFSGPPGVGKSTFIEKLGLEIIKANTKVAVLAIDPSSLITGGSILGDKTRMEELSRQALAFVRPSPNRGHLGGVTSSLPAAILLCEAAGYEWILIESVGVGQSEVELSQMVDLFTLIAQPGTGDELQGIKKGILEYVDLVVVNKVDRDPALVNIAKQQLLGALKIIRPQEVRVESCSALTGAGIVELFSLLQNIFVKYDYTKRSRFARCWYDSLLMSEFKKRMGTNAQMQELNKKLRGDVETQNKSPMAAVDEFFADLGLKS